MLVDQVKKINLKTIILENSYVLFNLTKLTFKHF